MQERFQKSINFGWLGIHPFKRGTSSPSFDRRYSPAIHVVFVVILIYQSNITKAPFPVPCPPSPFAIESTRLVPWDNSKNLCRLDVYLLFFEAIVKCCVWLIYLVVAFHFLASSKCCDDQPIADGCLPFSWHLSVAVTNLLGSHFSYILAMGNNWHVSSSPCKHNFLFVSHIIINMKNWLIRDCVLFPSLFNPMIMCFFFFFFENTF